MDKRICVDPLTRGLIRKPDGVYGFPGAFPTQ